MAIIGSKQPKNYIHVVFNNGAHDSVGGQPTVGLDIDLPGIARSVRYNAVHTVSDIERFEKSSVGYSVGRWSCFAGSESKERQS